MSRLPSRRFAWAGIVLWVGAVAAGWGAVIWPPAIFAMSVLLAISLVLVLLGLRPARAARHRREAPPLPHQAPPAPVQRREHVPLRYPLLRPEDEADVERMYQRLKTVGRLDSKSSSDET